MRKAIGAAVLVLVLAAILAAGVGAVGNGILHRGVQAAPAATSHVQTCNDKWTALQRPSALLFKLYCHDGIRVGINNPCSISASQPMPETIFVEGLTPNDVYVTVAFYPRDSKFKGQRYPPTGLTNLGAGRADAHGGASHWAWDCTVGADMIRGHFDPTGIYRTQLTDARTGHRVTFPVIVTS